MNESYLTYLGASALVCAGILALRLKRAGDRPWKALLCLVLSILLGAALAKVFYVLPMIGRVWHRYGLGALLRTNESEFSFFGGCVGAMLGAALTAKLTGRKAAPFLDAFAPVGALMAGLARGGEYFLGTLGAGSAMKNEAFCRFPFAIQNDWGEWLAAVFMLEALLALLAAAWAFLRKKERSVPGLLAARTAFYLCLPQILCESLRSRSIAWGFVRVEQLLCAVLAVGMIAVYCAKTPGKGFFRRFGPALATLPCIALIVFVEFALDRGILYMTNKLFGLPAVVENSYVPQNKLVCYLIMILALVVIAGMEIVAVRRYRRGASSAPRTP